MNESFIASEQNELPLTINGQPVSLMRPRTFVKGGRTTTWSPSKEKMLQARAELRVQIKTRGMSITLPELPIKDPCQLQVSFRMKAIRKKDRGQHHSIRPDIDNLIKFLLDVGNGVLWSDDSLIHTIIANKIYHENPHTFFRIVW